MPGHRYQGKTTSDEQHDSLKAYAIVKGFKGISDFSLYAMVTMTAKNPLTGVQKARADKIIGDMHKDALAVPLSPKAGEHNGREVI